MRQRQRPAWHYLSLSSRYAAFGWEGWTGLARVGALLLFAFVIWRIAIHAMTRKLVD